MGSRDSFVDTDLRPPSVRVGPAEGENNERLPRALRRPFDIEGFRRQVEDAIQQGVEYTRRLAGERHFVMQFSTGSATVGAGLTRYIGTAGVGTTFGAQRQTVPKDAEAIALFVRTQNAPGVSESFTYTLLKNGTSTAIVATMTDTDTSASDKDSVNYDEGDAVAVELVTSGAAATTVHHVTVLFKVR